MSKEFYRENLQELQQSWVNIVYLIHELFRTYEKIISKKLRSFYQTIFVIVFCACGVAVLAGTVIAFLTISISEIIIFYTPLPPYSVYLIASAIMASILYLSFRIIKLKLKNGLKSYGT